MCASICSRCDPSKTWLWYLSFWPNVSKFSPTSSAGPSAHENLWSTGWGGDGPFSPLLVSVQMLILALEKCSHPRLTKYSLLTSYFLLPAESQLRWRLRSTRKGCRHSSPWHLLAVWLPWAKNDLAYFFRWRIEESWNFLTKWTNDAATFTLLFLNECYT